MRDYKIGWKGEKEFEIKEEELVRLKERKTFETTLLTNHLLHMSQFIQTAVWHLLGLLVTGHLCVVIKEPAGSSDTRTSLILQLSVHASTQTMDK